MVFKSKKTASLEDYLRHLQDLTQQSGDEDGPTKGSGLLFRLAYNTHLSLSNLADRKAHLMIVVNVFILSFVVAKKKTGILFNENSLFVPNILLALVCLTTIVLATLVTRPRLPQKVTNRPPEAVNWFFFGEFCHYPMEVFHKNISHLMRNDRRLYAAMTRDLYWMGVALGRKFRLLRLCYDVFYYGMLCTAVVYVLAAFWP